ncbi:MAG TPA: hypothetical protein VMB51_01100 [Solirubrobacteraceae bacterium]|nr:hypothetical protein [Solirubrobacteraceae bacterium]
MGYSHYFAYDPRAEPFIAAWPRMVADAAVIATHVQNVLGVRLAGGTGEGPPEIDERRIWLNGPAEQQLDHDTFLIDLAPCHAGGVHATLAQRRRTRQRSEFERRGFVLDSCKTNRKPYDIAVTSILLRCRHLAPNAFVIASDGAWEREWQHGALHWDAACPTSVGPVDVLATLFAQIERPAASRLAANVLCGPPSATLTV